MNGGPAKGVGGSNEPTTPQGTNEPQIGEMQEGKHSVTWLKQGRDFAPMVPDRSLTSDADFKHKVEWAKDSGVSKFRAAILIIYYKVLIALGILKKVDTMTQEMQDVTPRKQDAEGSRGVPVEAPKKPPVQVSVDREQELENKWKEISKLNIEKNTENSGKVSTFWYDVDARLEELKNKSPYTGNEQKERLQRLATLKKATGDKLFGPTQETWDNKFIEAKKDSQSQSLFTFYQAVEKEENRLKKVEIALIADDAKNERLKILEDLKGKTKDELENRCETAKLGLQQAIPKEVKEAQEFVKTAPATLKEEQKKLETLTRESTQAGNELEVLRQQSIQLPKDVIQLKQGKKEKYKELIEPLEKEWEIRKGEFEKPLNALLKDNDRLEELENIKKGNVKVKTKPHLKYFIAGETITEVTRELTKNEKEELAELMSSQVPRSGDIKKHQETLQKAQKEFEIKKNSHLETIAQLFDKGIEEKEEKITQLPNKIKEKESAWKLKQTEQEQANTKVLNLQSKLKSSQQTLLTAKKELEPQIKTFLRAAVVQSAFQAYEIAANKGDNVQMFINLHMSSNREKLNNQLVNEISDLGLTIDSVNPWLTSDIFKVV